MARSMSDEQLDRAIARFLTERRAEIEASATPADRAAARVGVGTHRIDIGAHGRVIGGASWRQLVVRLAVAILVAVALLSLALGGAGLFVGGRTIAPAPSRTPGATGLSTTAPSTAPQPSAEPTPVAALATAAASPAEAPSELEVACDGTRTDIATPLVRTQPDGVHIHFANTSGRTLEFGIDNSSGLALLGSSVPVEGGSYDYTFGPGSYHLACGGSGTTFAVVDPDRFYTAELLCTDQFVGSVDNVGGARGPQGSLLDVARTELRGLQPGDVVEHAGYPQAAGDQLVRVVRNGEVIAVLAYASDGHGGWLITGTRTCSGSNVTTVSPKG